MDEKFSFLEPTLEKKLKGHHNGITSLFFSPDEQQLASSSLDNSILLWDLQGSRSYRFQGHDEAVMDVTFSQTGKYMASASRDKTVRLWVPTITGSTGVFKAHSQTVRSVQFGPDGSKIITASDDKIVKLWSTDKLKFISSFLGHTNWVRCARMSSDGSVIASCSDDKTTRLWNPETGECIHTFKKDQKGHGLHLAWHPSNCYIAVGTSHGNVKIYDIRTHNLVQYYSIHKDAVTQLAFHPSGSYILTASKDGKVKILDLLEGHPIFTLSGHSGAVNSVSFSPSGDLFATAGEDKLVFMWKTNFTELSSEMKENVTQSETPLQQRTKLTTGKKQGMRIWYLCYHSTKYPVVSFVHSDDSGNHESKKITSFEEPNANSTLLNPDLNSHTERHERIVNSTSSLPGSTTHSVRQNVSVHTEWPSDEHSSYDVGHICHIPRTPPNPTTYTIPSINKSIVTDHSHKGDLFGMIKLKDNDVCYTSGSIEWVGRKRSFPINSGFKIINDSLRQGNEPLLKKVKRLDKTFTLNADTIKDCDCADVLPTVNAIVDHLNALHEAVDLVDLRLNTLEGVVERHE